MARNSETGGVGLTARRSPCEVSPELVSTMVVFLFFVCRLCFFLLIPYFLSICPLPPFLFGVEFFFLKPEDGMRMG